MQNRTKTGRHYDIKGKVAKAGKGYWNAYKFSTENITYWREMGVDMISAGADFDFLTLGIKSAKENMARIIKG